MTEINTKLSIEKQVYSITEGLKEYIHLPNDRNRLAYCLYKYVKGEGDSPEILVKSTKIKFTGITGKQLISKLNEAIITVKK